MKKLNFVILVLLLQSWLPREAEAADPPIINSGAAIVMDAKTGEVLYEKNPRERKYPASLTKVATAIYAIEKGNLEDEVSVSQAARETEGTRVYLEEGEKVPLRKLIQGLLINSGNDAGVAIAEHLDGSVEQFAKNLNVYLAGIGTKDTVFKNPHGLFDPDHVTSANDLALITQYAMENDEFRKIFGTTELPWDGESWDTTLFTHHKLMRERPYDGVTGGKTGYVDQSGNTLITTAQRDNINLIIVTLEGSSQEIAYNDTTVLLDYAFSHYMTTRISKGTTIPMGKGVYKTEKDYYFTQPIDQNVTMRIDSNGELEILDENQGIISSFQIENLLPKPQKKSKAMDGPVRNEDDGDFIIYIVGFTILALLAWRTLYLIKRKKKYAFRNSGQNGL